MNNSIKLKLISVLLLSCLSVFVIGCILGKYLFLPNNTEIVIEEIECNKEHYQLLFNEFLDSIKVLEKGKNKTYMDFRNITDKSSKQYDFIFNNEKMKLSDDGFLIDSDGYIGVALGSYFGNIGDRFIFELDSGIFLKLVKVDEKSDVHTDENNYAHKYDESVIEFVVDTTKMAGEIGLNGLIYNGNFNNCEKFCGNIVNIWKVESYEK